MTRNEIETAVVDAFHNNKKVKVVRRCHGDEEICIGFIYEVSRRERSKTNKKEMGFSMVADSDWWKTKTLSSLAPWCSQISEIEVVK